MPAKTFEEYKRAVSWAFDKREKELWQLQADEMHTESDEPQATRVLNYCDKRKSRDFEMHEDYS